MLLSWQSQITADARILTESLKALSPVVTRIKEALRRRNHARRTMLQDVQKNLTLTTQQSQHEIVSAEILAIA